MGAEGAGRIPLIDERRCKKRLEDPELDALADWLRKHGKPICPSLRLAVAWTSGDLTTVEDFRIGGSAGQTYRLYVLLRPESRVLKVLLVDQELNASRVVDQRQDRPQDYSSGYAVYNNPADPRCGDLELQAGNPQAPSSTQTLRLFQSWWKSVRPKG
jgi:hypothetical protein